MKITYNNSIDLNDYKKLLADAGWKILSDKQHLNSINNSIFISCCICDDEVVGMARLVGDGSVHGLLCDVVVSSEYRHMGIGRNLIKNIKDDVYNMLEDNEQFLIELCPSYGKRNFYLNCGFKYKPENMDGMYLWIKK
jgi:predicted GNAT family N-acyltransferase